MGIRVNVIRFLVGSTSPETFNFLRISAAPNRGDTSLSSLLSSPMYYVLWWHVEGWCLISSNPRTTNQYTNDR